MEFAVDSPGTAWSREWVPDPSAAREVQAGILSNAPFSSRAPGENSLALSLGDRLLEVSWGAETEDAQLATIRRGILAAAHVTYFESLVHLLRGNNLAKSGNAQESTIEIQRGIALPGYSYLTPHLTDDSDFRHILGTIEQKKENWEDAVPLLQRVLEFRTMQYAARHGLPPEPARGLCEQ